MKKIVIAYLVTMLLFLILDALWLGVISRSFYAAYLGPLFPIKFSYIPAGIFYAMYIAGILHFAIWPALEKNSLKDAAINGALLGGLC